MSESSINKTTATTIDSLTLLLFSLFFVCLLFLHFYLCAKKCVSFFICGAGLTSFSVFFWLLLQCFKSSYSSKSFESGVQRLLCFPEARFLSLKLVNANPCEHCHFYICKDVASNLPLTHVKYKAHMDSALCACVCVFICVHVLHVLYDCVCFLCMF